MKKILIMFAVIAALALPGAMDISSAMPGSSHSGTVSDQGAASLRGKVLETMDSGGYTYVNIGHDGGSTWVAVPETKVEVGEEVSALPGFAMNDFKSKTLDRTFESIIFSSGLAADAEIEKAMMSGDMPSDATHSGLVPADETAEIKVEKAPGPNAYTVAELYSKSGELDAKNIVLKGQVVKFAPAILGKNWIHIQDGSGSAADGNDDMTVTTQDTPSVGDVVTVNGTLHNDKDFGMGYFYEVIIEDATLE